VIVVASERQRRACSGFSLTEVLIALVILSVGLLAIARLVNTSLKTNDSAYLRSQATMLAYSVLERMRANRKTALAGGYNVGFGPPPSATDCMGASTVCGPADMAQFDLAAWKKTLAKAVHGDGKIETRTVGNAGTGQFVQAVVTVRWNDARAGGKSDASLSVSSAL
jgi:type IV pilus assembly protein PilV